MDSGSGGFQGFGESLGVFVAGLGNVGAALPRDPSIRPRIGVLAFQRHLGIILDGYLHSAPSIRSAIYQRGEITGDFTLDEVFDLVDILNAGSLPAPLKKVGERPVDPP